MKTIITIMTLVFCLTSQALAAVPSKPAAHSKVAFRRLFQAPLFKKAQVYRRYYLV